MDYISGLVLDALLLSLGKNELVALSTVSKRLRRAVFACPRSQHYAKSPLQDISHLSTSFDIIAIYRQSDRDYIRKRNLVVHRLWLLSDNVDISHDCIVSM